MQENTSENTYNDLIIGRNPIIEALKSGRDINHILISEKNHTGSLKVIVSKARDLGIPIKNTVKKDLDSISSNSNHQGVIAVAAAKNYCSIDEILESAKKLNQPPFIIIADCIEDPQNLGSIIRIAECVGAHGVIIQKRRSPGLTYSVDKSSAGALEHMLVSRESNISYTIEKLKKLNIWVYGADATGSTWCSQDLSGPIALVIGSEGYGISNIVKSKCDILLSLPMLGKITSLNAASATAVISYEICRQRLNLQST